MFKKIIFIGALALGLLLSGCVTQYKPLGYNGGYTDMQINADTYQVTFLGNNYTSQERIRNLLLYRCANLTNISGYEYFTIIDKSEQQLETTHVHPAYISTETTDTKRKDPENNKNHSNVENRTREITTTTTFNPETIDVSTAYREIVTIKMLHSDQGQKEVYKASSILSSFNPKIGV